MKAYFLMSTVRHLLDDVSENLCSESKGTSADSVVQDLPLHIPCFSDIGHTAAYNAECRKGLLHLYLIYISKRSRPRLTMTEYETCQENISLVVSHNIVNYK